MVNMQPPFVEADLPEVRVTVRQTEGHATIGRTITYNTTATDLYLNCRTTEFPNSK